MLDEITIPLTRTPLWNSSLSLLSAVAAAFSINTLIDVGPGIWAGGRLDAEGALSVAIMAVSAAVVLLTLAKRALVRRRPLAFIRMGASSMRLPVHPESLRHHEVPYTAIIAVGEGGRTPKRHFFIESTRRIYHLPQQLFVDPQGPETLFLALRERLKALPIGTQRLVDTERERAQALRAMNVRPMVTHALLGINGVFFLNTWLKGALDVPFGLLRWGANASALVYRGEFYRLASANFLHGHWLHITMNMLALWYLGSLMERLLGWARFSLLYLLAGALAMAASAYTAGAVMTVGASGAIFGLLGGFALISMRLRRALPMGVRQTPRWWISMLAVNMFIPLLWPVVDLTAHVAGFITGAVLTGGLLGRRKTVPVPAGTGLQGLAIAVMVVYVAALAQAVVCAAKTTASQEVRFGKLLLADARTPPTTLNTLAWLWMADPSSTQEHLQAAKDAAQEAVTRSPGVPEYQATLGMVCQRLTDLSCAQRAWLGAMELAYGDQAPDGIIRNDGGVAALYAFQFARVLHRHAAAPDKTTPRSTAGHDAAPQNPWPADRVRDTWQVTPPQSQAFARRLYVLGEGVGGEAVALATVVLPAGHAAPWPLPAALSHAFNDAGVRRAQVMWWQPEAKSAAAGQAPLGWALWRLPASASGNDDEAP